MSYRQVLSAAGVLALSFMCIFIVPQMQRTSTTSRAITGSHQINGEADSSDPVVPRPRYYCRAYDGPCLLMKSSLMQASLWGTSTKVLLHHTAVVLQSTVSNVCYSNNSDKASSSAAALGCSFPRDASVGISTKQRDLGSRLLLIPSPTDDSEGSEGVSRHSEVCPTATVLIPFHMTPQFFNFPSGLARMRRVFDRVISGRESNPALPEEAIRQCTHIALTSPCSHGFQLERMENTDNSSYVMRCVVYGVIQTLSQGVPSRETVILPHNIFFALMHAPESRPSLLRDHLRLVVTLPPTKLVRLRLAASASNDAPIGLQIRRKLGEITVANLATNISVMSCVVTVTVPQPLWNSGDTSRQIKQRLERVCREARRSSENVSSAAVGDDNIPALHARWVPQESLVEQVRMSTPTQHAMMRD